MTMRLRLALRAQRRVDQGGAGLVPRPARRERRRQVHAGQVHHGLLPPHGRLDLVDGREVEITLAQGRAALSLGMVYQQFTLVPSLTGAENLVISRQVVPGIIDWAKETKDLDAFMDENAVSACRSTCRPAALAAGQKQKLEILKQLYLGQHFLVLDEPTSVLTPGEAEEVLGLVRRNDRRRRHHRADDLPQVPRGDGLLPTKSPCCARASSSAPARPASRSPRTWPR